MGYLTLSNEILLVFIWDYISFELHLQPKTIPFTFRI